MYSTTRINIFVRNIIAQQIQYIALNKSIAQNNFDIMSLNVYFSPRTIYIYIHPCIFCH